MKGAIFLAFVLVFFSVIGAQRPTCTVQLKVTEGAITPSNGENSKLFTVQFVNSGTDELVFVSFTITPSAGATVQPSSSLLPIEENGDVITVTFRHIIPRGASATAQFSIVGASSQLSAEISGVSTSC
eukprot:Phypoly_transcript_17516.p1 GENE.Phypoly_transcript_17516~~Phypoly_transcript_17516.p1  ORF type:complete len:148 (+),score=19.11 Phypoly_transcript_17516:61-444(+)